MTDSLLGIDISNTSSQNPAIQNIILQEVAKTYNDKNSKGEQAFNSYNQALPDMNFLLQQFVASRNNIEKFTSTQDNILSNQEILNAINQRSTDISRSLENSITSITDTTNSTYQNIINQLEAKKAAIEASSKAVDDYWNLSKNDFNNNYSTENDMKNKIMTANRIIQIQEEEYENKVFYSALFGYFLVYLISLAILFKIRIPLGMSLTFFGSLISLFSFIFVLMVLRKWFQRNNILYKIEHSTAKALKSLAEDPISNLIDELLGPCPDKCNNAPNPNLNKKPTITKNLTTGLEMKTDITTNVWKDGDVTGTIGIQPAYPGLPQSLLEKTVTNPDGTTSTQPNPLTQYTCVWNGEINSGINPSKNELKTNVPCEYLPGYIYKN